MIRRGLLDEAEVLTIPWDAAVAAFVQLLWKIPVEDDKHIRELRDRNDELLDFLKDYKPHHHTTWMDNPAGVSARWTAYAWETIGQLAAQKGQVLMGTRLTLFRAWHLSHSQFRSIESWHLMQERAYWRKQNRNEWQRDYM